MAKQQKLKLDMMSVTVLLVMSLFGGVVGYFLGKGATAAQMVSFREAAVMMKDNGAMMQDAGKMMEDRGKRWGDREMTDKAKTMLESGTMMSGKSEGMMGMMGGY